MAGNVVKTEALSVRLAAGDTLVDAAEAVGYSPRHAARIAATPAVRERVRELRSALTDRLLGRLIESSLEAEIALRALLRDESPAARLGAAKAILQIGGQVRETVEIQTRLQAIELRLSEFPTLRGFLAKGSA